MPKRKQGEVDNEGVQDFELIELLIREAGSGVGSNPSTSTQQGNDFESFKARFQSYIDQVPSYLHSVGKEGFFPHFFLGSFSTLIDTEIATKLNIEKIYFSFDSSKTLKVAVIKKGEIKSPEDAADKVRLFVIAESGSTKKKFSYGELDKILGNTKVARNNVVRLARDQGKLGVRLVEITKEKEAKGKMAGISVNVESNKLDNDASTIHEFKEVKKGLWNNPESDIAKLTNPDVEKVEKPVENILKKVSKIHSEYKGSLIYGKEVREAAHHGFIAGALVNFRYRHNLRVYLEQFAGRGYADIVLVPRGKDRSLNAVPIIIELKAGTAAGTTPGSALEQAKDYAKGFQPNTMRVLTISDNVLCIGLNLDSTEAEKFSMYISPHEDREIAPPTMQALLKEASDWDGREDTITNIKEKIKQPLERIYHTFPGTPEKGGNYFSRFLLGQLLLADKFKRVDLKKFMFSYGEYPLVSTTRSGKPVTTFTLIREGRSKETFILHVREGGRGDRSSKKIPISVDLPEQSKITEVYISLHEKKESDFFNIEEVNRYNSLNEYKEGKEFFKGELKDVPYSYGLREAFDEALRSQVTPAAGQSLSVDKYNALLKKLGEGMFSFRDLINEEAHFQGVLHGAFSYYSDLKLEESPRALILTEFQTGRGKRIDMVVHGIKFADQASSAKEYDPVGLELKGPREGKTADALKDEANKQITDEYKKGVTYKTLTDGTEVAFMGVVFDKGANNADSLILMSKDEFASVKVVHSSIFSISQQQCSKGRKTRSLGMACIDSRDEEMITEKEKERLIKELFGIDNAKDFNAEIESYGSKIIAVNSERKHNIIDNVEEYRTEVYVTVRDNGGNDKKLTIDDIAKILRAENYIVVGDDNYEIWLRTGSKDYVITEKMEGQDIKYYLDIDGYKIKLDSIIENFTTDSEKKAIYNKLHQLSNEIELYENKKYIEDIGGAKDIEVTNQDYDNIVNEIKQSLLEKGVSENAFDQFRGHFDDLNEKVFAEYIGNVEGNLRKQGIAFDHDKFDSAKIKGAKSGKFFSLMAIYDLFDSIGDTATLGRYDNDALKRVFGINGILDAMDDVRTSVSISHTSKVGKLINKIPQPVRQTFVKIISNPVVQSITFATIAYQFGYSVNEIAQGNHHPLNYYWTISSGVKLASMGIRPISTGISFAIKSVSTTTKILRGLSAAGKVLGKISVFTMVPDIVFSLHQLLYSRTMEAQAIAAQIPISNIDRTKIFFSNSEKAIYEDYIRIKSYLNTVKSNAISYLNSDSNIAAVVQYVTSIEEKYSEIIKTIEKKHVCAGKGLGCSDQWTCELEKRYESISFNKVNITSNVKDDLSSLNISRPLDLEFYQLDDIGATRFKSIEKYEEFLAKQEKKKVYLISKEAKHLPHITQDEHNSGLRVVMAPSGHLIPQHQCSGIINEERIFQPYALGKAYMPCNAGKTYRNCQGTFTLSGKPFIFTNFKRKDLHHIKKEIFPKGSVLYISGPRTLTAAANYPAVMYVPDGYVNYVGSKNNGTTFIINNPMSGLLEGGVEKENTVVINFKANNIAADLYNGTVHYGSTGNIKLVNIYNYVSNSDSKQNITTHCKTRLINAKNAEVRQNSFNCVDKDYEVRVVNKENVHHRGLKQTIFVINEDSDNARIVSDWGGTGRIKENIDVIDVRISDITKLKINENTERNVYSLGLLGDNAHSVVSSVKVNDFKNLVIQAKRSGITESVIIQDKSLSNVIEDMRYQKLNGLGKDIDREVIQKRKLKASVQASILDSKWANTYQIAKGIANYNNLGIPISQIEVVKNYMGVPTEKTIIAGMYSDQVIADFSYNNPNFTRGNYYYDIVCNYYQNIMVEGRKGRDQYVIKLPEYSHILQHEDLMPSIELDLNLEIRNKAVLYQNIPDDIIDLTALNVTDVNSINMGKGRRNYFNKCDKMYASDLTVDSLEIKNVKASISEDVKWSLSIGLVDYFKGPEYQNIVLRMNNKFYKIDNANLKLEHVEVNAKPFRYYQPDEQGLQVYHNQPINKNVIGLVDLKEKSIFGFDMEVVGDNLSLLHKNNTIAKVENWNTYQPARKMIFAFNDTIVSNSNCIAFTCNSKDIIEDFNKAKEILLKEQLFNAIKQNNTNEVKNLIRKIADNVDTKDKHELISLHIAIQEGRLDVVELLFNRGSVNVKDKDIHGYSPLHWAAQEDELSIAKFLVDKGANIEDRGKDGRTPSGLANQKGYTYIVKFLKQVQLDRGLLTAAESGDLNKVNDLVKQGASLEAKDDDYGNTPLHYASLNGNLRVVEYFIKNEANSRARNFVGETPVHYASFYGNLEVVKYFIENGAGLEDKDITGKTLLNSAALGGHFKVVEYLTEKGANLEAKDDNGYTPLHYASLNNDLDIAKYLIKNWASLEARGKNDKTPLNLAIQNGFIDVEKILKQAQLDRELLNAARNSDLDKVKDLIKDGASLEAKDWHGRAPLHHASLNGDLDMVEYLIRQNVALDVQNLYGSAPLHDASWSGHLKVVEYLIKNKADFEVKDKYDQTPLHHASRNGHLKVVEYLIEEGANLVTDKYGRTPLDLAAQKGYTNIVEFLKQAQLDRGLFTAIQDGNHDKSDRNLMTAVRSGNLDKVKDLVINQHANVNANIGIYNYTSLHHAADTNALDTARFLVGAGADLGAKDDHGKTPLDIARDKGHSNIVEYLEKKLNEKGEKSVQRRRRHHHGDHNRHHNHLSSKPRAIDLSNQPEIAASSGTRPSSWINDLFSWVKSSVSRLFYSRAALSEETLNTTSSISQINAPIDVNGTIMLLDMLIRKITGQKYMSSVDQPVSLLEAQGHAFNITKEFKKVVEQAALKSDISMHRLNIDFMEMQKEITRKIIGGKFDEVSGVLKSHIEKACPGREAGCPGKLSPKKFDKFITEFNNKLDVALNQSMQQILHSRSSTLEVSEVKEQQISLEPRSYLNNTSVQGHLAQGRDLRLR